MPKPSLEPSITTTAEIELSPRLKTKLSKLLKEYQSRHGEIERLSALQDEAKDVIETEFASADEYEALLSGVRVDDIPLKRIEGQKTKKTDYAGIMKRWKITPKEWAKFVTEAPKKGYLSISLPRRKKDEDE